MLRVAGLFLSLFFIFSVVTTQNSYAQNIVWAEILKDIRGKYPEVTQISTDSLATWLTTQDADQPILIDVREEQEYAISHIQGAHQLSPDAMSFPMLTGVDKSTPIVLYCSVGYRSSKMAERLTQAGFTNVANLEGSIFTWANEGHEVVKDGEPVQSVHAYNRIWGRLLKKPYRKYK